MNRFPIIKKQFLLFSSSFLLSSCGSVGTQQQNSETADDLISIRVAPEGVQPRISLQPGGTKICRRGLPDESVYNLTPDEAEEALADQEQAEEATQTSGTEQRIQTITTDVEAAWFEMGLEIGNRSDKYYLKIDQLIFYISANWGSELLSSRIEINSGSYCQSDPLYIITPKPRGASKPEVLQYLPFKKNHPNNLILYISGVSIPEGPPKREEDESGSSPVLDNIRANLEQQAQQPKEQFVLNYLPPYKVQLTLHGEWIDRDRRHIANFRKKITFSITSQFLN